MSWREGYGRWARDVERRKRRHVGWDILAAAVVGVGIAVLIAYLT